MLRSLYKIKFVFKLLFDLKKLVIFYRLIIAEHKASYKKNITQEDIEISKKIIPWFKKLKVDENKLNNKNLSVKIKPSEMWLEIIKEKHNENLTAIKDNDYKSLACIFKNLMRHDSSYGLLDHDIIDLPYTKIYSNFLKRYKVVKKITLIHGFLKNMNNNDLDKYLKLISNDIGNPIKLMFKKHEYSFDMISHLLISLDLNKIQPLVALRGKRVADLGSGLGITLNILHKLTKTKVYFIDIPENLILAAAISMYFSPTAKKYFYDPNKQINDNYDMYFIPHYAINKIPKNFISLFINVASLPEMRKVSSKYYMDQIYKSLESNGKFFSINRTYTHQHKTFTDFNMTSIRDIVGEVSFEIEKSLPLQNSYSYANENNNNTDITLYKKI